VVALPEKVVVAVTEATDVGILVRFVVLNVDNVAPWTPNTMSCGGKGGRGGDIP
jgi:hypothetical protein